MLSTMGVTEYTIRKCFVQAMLWMILLAGCNSVDSDTPADQLQEADSLEESGQKNDTPADQFQEADSLWESGQKNEAVSIYESLITGKEGMAYIHRERSGDVPRIYKRVIDVRIEKGGPGVGRLYIRDAVKKHITLSLDSPEANAILAEEKEKHRAKVAAGRIDVTLEQARKLRVGMTPDEVIEILGEPDERMMGLNSKPVQRGQLMGFVYSGSSFTESTFVYFADDGVPTGKVTRVRYKGDVVVGSP